jgi:hypothetical protein
MKEKILVVILAETRAHKLTFKTQKKYLIDPLKADVAVCIGRKPGETFKDDPFYEISKYRFVYDEKSDDFQSAFESIGGKADMCSHLSKIQDQLFGGVVCSGHKGSAGILLFFRRFLADHLVPILHLYDFIIVTRSDYYYEFPHPKMVPGKILIPRGEDFRGLTDRHMACPSSFIIDALTIVDPILSDGERMVSVMSLNAKWNLEQYIKFMFVQRGLYEHVVRFPRVMYAVREESTKTRWAQGDYDKDAKMIVKYRDEYDAVKAMIVNVKEKKFILFLLIALVLVFICVIIWTFRKISSDSRRFKCYTAN